MAIPTNYISTVTYGQVDTTKVNRENYEDWITNLDRIETPLLSSIGHEDITGMHVDWTTETMRNPVLNSTVGLTMIEGQDEGAAFAAEAMPAMVRKRNVTQIFESFWGLTRTQITISKKGGTAGIRDLAAKYSKKVMAELMTAVEARVFSVKTANGNLTGAKRLMKTLDDATSGSGMITDNSALGYGSNILSLTAGSAVGATEADFRSVIQACWRGGLRVGHIHLSPGWKQYASMNFVGYGSAQTPVNRSVDNKTVIAVVDTFQTDWGSAKLIANIWVTEAGYKVGTDGAAETDAGRIWFLQHDMLKIGWLDRFQSNLMGRVGDGLGFQTVGECTLIVKSDRMGAIKKVSLAPTTA